MGSPKLAGTWQGTIKTVSGLKSITTPFFELALKDVHNTLHIIRCLQIPSIGQSNLLSYDHFMKLCQTLKINPSLVQQPAGDNIHILIGLDALNLLCHPVTVVPDQFAREGVRKLHYPTPHFDNLRLFSTPLNAKLFFAGFYISPINHVPGAYFSKVGVNGFVCPHGRVDETDTNFKHYSPKELFDLNFTPQNVELRPGTQVHYIPGSVSPPRMDLSYEEEIPVLFSPLTDHEDD